MDNARVMRHIQRIGNLSSKVEQLIERDGLSLDTVLQCGPFQVLHHDVVTPVIFANVVNSADVGVVQSRRCPGLTLKTDLAPADHSLTHRAGTLAQLFGPAASPRPHTPLPYRRRPASARCGNARWFGRSCKKSADRKC